jgi:hypothetical protein
MAGIMMYTASQKPEKRMLFLGTTKLMKLSQNQSLKIYPEPPWAIPAEGVGAYGTL